MISPQPNLITRRTRRLLLVWTLTIDLSGMGGPTGRNKSPASIAVRFTETHKPVHHDKVAITHGEGIMGMECENIPIRFEFWDTNVAIT